MNSEYRALPGVKPARLAAPEVRPGKVRQSSEMAGGPKVCDAHGWVFYVMLRIFRLAESTALRPPASSPDRGKTSELSRMFHAQGRRLSTQNRDPIGYFHIDIAEVQTDEGRLYLFVAIDRTSKFAYVELHEQSGRSVAKEFLDNLVCAVPYNIHIVLTDNGAPFCIQPRYRNGPAARHIRHMFDQCCDRHGIEHRLTKPKHPWTNGQVERMNRTIKEATVKRYHYHSHDPLKAHLQTFLMACNFARRLKALKGLTPYEYVCKIWTTDPQRFTIDPTQHTVGLNNFLCGRRGFHNSA